MITEKLSRQLSRALVMALPLSLVITLGTGTQTASAAPLLEAENATVFHGTVDSDHAGFSGTGFVNYANEVGSYVEWTVESAQAGETPLTFRFANGTGTGRPLAISVNGTDAATGTFGPTGAWTNWQTESVNATSTPHRLVEGPGRLDDAAVHAGDARRLGLHARPVPVRPVPGLPAHR